MCYFICCEIALGYVERNKTITSDLTRVCWCFVVIEAISYKWDGWDGIRVSEWVTMPPIELFSVQPQAGQQKNRMPLCE